MFSMKANAVQKHTFRETLQEKLCITIFATRNLNKSRKSLTIFESIGNGSKFDKSKTKNKGFGKCGRKLGSSSTPTFSRHCQLQNRI